MEQLSLKDEVRELLLELKSYLEIKYDIARLGLVETTAVVATIILMGIALLVLAFSAVLFFSFGLAFYLGKLWDNIVMGFVAVGGGYAFITLTVFLLRNTIIQKPILRSLIAAILPSEPESLKEEEVV